MIYGYIKNKPEVNIDVDINGITVASGATSDVSLNLIDQDSNPVPFTQTGDDLEVNIPVIQSGWNRPAEWLPIPFIGSDEAVLYILVAVFPNQPNVVAFTASVSGGVNIDWGDGTSYSGANINHEHAFNYNDLDPLTEYNGYRQALIKISGVNPANQWGTLDFIIGSTTYPSVKSFNFLDVVIGCKSVGTIVTNHRFGSGVINYPMLQRIKYANSFNFYYLSNWLTEVRRLEKLEIPAGTYQKYMYQAFMRCGLKQLPEGVVFKDDYAYQTFDNSLLEEVTHDFSTSSSTMYIPFNNTVSRRIICLSLDASTSTQSLGTLTSATIQHLELHGYTRGHSLNGNSMYGVDTWTAWVDSLGTSADALQNITISTAQYNSFGGLGSYVDDEIFNKGYNLIVV